MYGAGLSNISTAGSPAMAPSHAGGRGTGLAEAQRSFAGVLARSDEAALPREEQARRGAEQLVAMTFVQPLLKSLRDSSMAAAPFAPTQGEKQFQSLMDAQVAQDLVRAAQFPLVDRLARDMLRRTPSAGAGAPTGAADRSAAS